VRLSNLIPQLLAPRENHFFGLLRSSTHNLHETTAALRDFMENYEDIEAKAAEIKRLEEVGDVIIHQIMTNLHRTFVTPFDREDIAELGARLDDVVDVAEEVARTMIEYRVTAPRPRAVELARIVEDTGAVLEHVGDMLQGRGGKLRELLPLTVELNRLENEADVVASQAVGELFANEKDPIEIIKWREIYQLLESATDRAEDAANVIEGIVLKNA
jgi:predicted phosphate transport protein (TIGR00153 family)